MIKEFIKETEDYVYKEVAKNLNLILGKNKTASLSTGMFLRLPMEVAVEKVDEPLPELDKSLKSFLYRFSAYTKFEDTSKVYFTFMYHNEKDLQKISKHLHRHNIFFAFVYLHEIQHILRKHITNAYEKMMCNIAKDVPAIQQHAVINIAEDYAINYSLKDLFLLSPSHAVNTSWMEIEKIALYNAEYHKNNLSDIEILKILIEDPNSLPQCTGISDSFIQVEQDGKTSTQPKEGSTGEPEDTASSDKKKINDQAIAEDNFDKAASDLADALKEIIQTNLKGTDIGDKFDTLFESVEVETGWFSRLKKQFKRNVYYMTHDYSSSWSNINNTYRRIYKAPKKVFMDDKFEIILAVDHSASVATTELQKLLYIIESESTKIHKLTVLSHTTEILKRFELTNDYDISRNPDFIQAMATRHGAGGTSHKCIFEELNNMKFTDINKVVFMCFSDMYSDIETTVKNYPVMRKLQSYWIVTSGGNSLNNVPGTVINL